jgi:endoglucanase
MKSGYQRGVNLGGWISQYPSYDHDHFRRFITAHDIDRIAGWGLDHVRLPVDSPVLVDEEGAFTYREDGFEYIDRCVEWCQHSGLNLVLDLHRAPGYSFTNTLVGADRDANTLFASQTMQSRFIDLWETLARRYLGVREPLAFELMNELVLPDSEPWNRLAGLTVDALRKIDPERAIIIGGNRYNAASELKNLNLLNDPGVFYTFHFYEPMLFTHQKARWSHETRLFDQELHYPGDITGLSAFLERHPQFAPAHQWQVGKRMDREMLAGFLQPAVEFSQATGLPLYCGEFGVIEGAPQESRVNWLSDFTGLLGEHGIGWAIWSYKAMDFGLVDRNGAVINQQAIDLLGQ